MADLEDLERKSITEMTPDEAIEHLRLIRLGRTAAPPPKKRKGGGRKTKMNVEVEHLPDPEKMLKELEGLK